MVRAIFIIFLVKSLTSVQASHSIQNFSLESKINETKLLFLKKQNKLVFKSNKYNTEINYSECSTLAIKRFIRKINRINKNSFTFRTKTSFTVKINNDSKQVSDRSILGKYISNLPSKLMTLKKEVKLSCKK